MVKYNFVIESYLKKTELKRVRIKVDPKYVNQEADLSKCDGYIGYVLQECDIAPKILVVTPDEGMSVMDIPQQHLYDLPDEEESEVIEQFKLYVCLKLKLDLESAETQLLAGAISIEEVEAALKQIGVTDETLKVLYRDFISDEGDIVTEDFNSFLAKAKTQFSNARAGLNNSAAATATNMAAKAVGNTLKSPAAYVKGLGAVAKFIGADHTAKALQGAAAAMTSIYKNVKDQHIKDAIKKLERPPDGTDLKTGDIVTVAVTKDNAQIKMKVDRVQGKTDDNQGSLVTLKVPPPAKTTNQPTKESFEMSRVERLIFEATPEEIKANIAKSRTARKASNFDKFAQNEKEDEQPAQDEQDNSIFDSIVIRDIGSTSVTVNYFKAGKQLAQPDVSSNALPTTAGLHKVDSKTWVLNKELTDNQYNNFKQQLAAVLKTEEAQKQLNLDPQKLQQKVAIMLKTTDNRQLQSSLGLDINQYNKLLELWLKTYGPGARQVQQQPAQAQQPQQQNPAQNQQQQQQPAK
jgi:hypothetical protein